MMFYFHRLNVMADVLYCLVTTLVAIWSMFSYILHALCIILVCCVIKQTLDFNLEEQLSLVDLTLALDNELLVSGNGIHQAALISYKDEIQFLQ